ncbi:MAG: DUF4143 domain-containing protein [Acidobacteria bacterium]|nr:DUF4143 domain-containing protein [Acidobacteriota bacterium]
MFPRRLTLPPPGARSFFLWGPRQVGKTTLLRQTYPDALWIDLLKADEFRRYATRPETLRLSIQAEGAGPSRQVVVDEVMKVPALLDEVHWMIENLNVRFALCASSARKVRRGAASLLGGRALRFELRGLTSAELQTDFDLHRILNYGFLPRPYQDPEPGQLLESYIADYLKEEIAAEGLVRNLPVFADFLEAAALADTEMVRFSNVAQDCGVSSQTVRAYYGILEDTLLGRWLPAWRKRPKRRVTRTPKFYFSDVGVVNRLGRRGELFAGSELFGKAFESWLFHEISAYLAYTRSEERLSYWRLAGGAEVDFIIGDMRIAIEAKGAARIGSRHLKGLRTLAQDHPEVQRRAVVCLEPRALETDDGIEILPVRRFLDKLWEDGFAI